jgi:hypothetical protein
MRQASVSLPEDQYLHFGYHVMLKNSKTGGFLGFFFIDSHFPACDI